jgi:hypothetical protein
MKNRHSATRTYGPSCTCGTARVVKTQDHRASLRVMAGLVVLALMMTACSTAANGAPAAAAPQPLAPQAKAGSLPPAVLRVVEREEVIDGFLYVYDDIYFTDPDGDAVAMTYTPVSSTLPYRLNLTDDPIVAAAEEQKGEALFTVAGRCWQRLELTFESRIEPATGANRCSSRSPVRPPSLWTPRPIWSRVSAWLCRSP